MLIRGAASLAVLGAMLAVFTAQADDLTTKDEKTYKDYKVLKSDGDGVTIQYTGTITIPFDELPDDVQKKFGHDPNALSAGQAAEKARTEAENQEAAKVEEAFEVQERQLKPVLTQLRDKAAAEAAAARKVDVTGQIFIATQGGETADFSGVHVGLVPMELADRWLAQQQARVAAEKHLLQPRIDRAQKDEDEALQERTAAVGTGRFGAALDKESQARDILDALIVRKNYFTDGEYYADSLAPWTTTGVTTDLGGKFTLSVQAVGDFVLTARVQSEMGSTVKKYFWFVKIHPGDNASILLDSENESSSGSNDSILKTEVSGTKN